MVEDAVQNDADAPVVGLTAQCAEVLLRTQHGVNGQIVRRVVAVVAVGLENGVQVDGADGQALEIVQLLCDAGQRAAEEVPVGDLAVFLRQEHRLIVPALVYPSVSHHPLRLRHGGAAETIWKYLVCHTLAEPGGGGGVLVDRQLPAGQGVLRTPAVFAEADGAAVAAGEAEGVPAQLRRLRGGVDPGKAALCRRQGDGLVCAGELPAYQQLAGVICLVTQGEGHSRAAGHGTKGGFAGAVLRVKNREHS